MKPLIIIVLAIATTSSSLIAGAMEQLKGVVIDDFSMPIELASVRMLSADSTFIDGAVTDSCGRFSMRLLPDARYVSVSALGYEDVSLGISSLSDTIRLHTPSLNLGEVTVNGTKNPVTLNGSNIMVDIQHTLLGDMPTTEDVLNHLPSVSGSGGTYQVFGRGVATIYINNRKVTDNGQLSRLRPSDIRKIEVVRNPGAEYDSDTPAVIRIYLKRSAFDGLGVDAMVYGSQGRRFSDYEQLSLTYGIGAVNLFFTAANSSSRLRSDQTNLQSTYTSAGIWEMISDMPRWDSEYYNLSLNGGLNITVSQAHQLGAKFSYTSDTQRNGGAKSSYMTLDDSPYEILASSSCSPQGYHQYLTNIYYEGRLSEKTDLVFNGDHIHRRSHNTDKITEEGNLTPLHAVENINMVTYNLWSSNLKLNWKPTDPLDFTFGCDGDIIKQNRTNNQTGNIYTSQLNSKESKYGLFAQGRFDLQKWSFSLGLRYEWNSMRYTDGISQMKLLDKDYCRLYPSASISTKYGKTDMTLSFTSKIRRPTFYQLRNSSEYFNRYETTEGNPMLLPTYTYDLTYSVGYSDITANIGYRWIKDYIAEENTINTADPLHMTSRPFNKPLYTAFDIGINYNKTFGCYHPYLSAELTKTFYTVEPRTLNTPNVGKTPSMRFTLSNNFTIGDYKLYLDLKYSPAGYYCQFWEDSYVGIDCGAYRRFFNKSLYVALQANNILASKSISKTFYANSVFERKSYRDTRRVALVISYTFRHSNKYRGKSSAQEQIKRLD